MEIDLGGSSKEERRRTIVALYREHRAALLRLARLLTDDEAGAEAVVRAACVRFYASWDGRRAITDPVDELQIALLHEARAHASPVRVRDMSPLPEDPHERVLAALRRLSPRQRECVVLRHYSSLTESQMARAIGSSIGTARTHYRRGMNVLAGFLEETVVEPVE